MVAVVKVIFDKKNNQKLDTISWFLVAAAILYFGFEIYNTLLRSVKADESQEAIIDSSNRNKDTLSAKMDLSDSNVNKHADDNRDSIEKALRRSNDSLRVEIEKKNIPATIQESQQTGYQREIGDSLLLTIVVKNFGSKDASHITELSAEITKRGNQLFVAKDKGVSGEDYMAPGSERTYAKPVLKSKLNSWEEERHYWFLALRYIDGSQNPSRTFRSLVSTNKPELHKAVYNLPQDEYDSIMLFLKKEKIW